MFYFTYADLVDENTYEGDFSMFKAKITRSGNNLELVIVESTDAQDTYKTLEGTYTFVQKINKYDDIIKAFEY